MELTQLSYSMTMISFKKCLKSAQEARAQIDTTVMVDVFTTYIHFLATIVQTDTLPNYRRSIAATMARGVSFSIELKTNVH